MHYNSILFPKMCMEHEVLLHPIYFGPNLMQTVKTKVFQDVEGTCTGKYVMFQWTNSYEHIYNSSIRHLFDNRYGYVIAVTTIDKIGVGVIQPCIGFVIFNVKYKAIVFRPFKGEVLEGSVTQVCFRF